VPSSNDIRSISFGDGTEYLQSHLN